MKSLTQNKIRFGLALAFLIGILIPSIATAKSWPSTKFSLPAARSMSIPGAWSALDTTSLNGTVVAIAISGSDIYVGGFFTNAGGNADADYIAKWNGSSWSALGSTPLTPSSEADSPVFDIVVSGTDIYVGGAFINAGGNADADYIAKWNGSSWSALGTTPLNDAVFALTMSGTDLYAGGDFYDAGGNSNADYIAKWNGSAWSALGSTPLNCCVLSIAISGTDVYAAGVFNDAGSDPDADYIAKWNGSAWSELGSTPFDNAVWELEISGTDLYASGAFLNAGGNADADYIAKWNGSAWSALGSTPLNNAPSALVMNGTDLYAGGSFVDAGGNSDADRIAKWNGSSWSALGSSSFNSTVITIAISGTDIYAGGMFTDAGGDSYADYIAVFSTLPPATATPTPVPPTPTVTPTPTPVVVTFTSDAGDDGYVIESSATSSVGGSNDNTTSQFFVGDTSANAQIRGIISFDTSSLPNNAIIQSAEIRIREWSQIGNDNPLDGSNLRFDIADKFGTAYSLQDADFEATPDGDTIAIVSQGSTPDGSGWYSTFINATGRGLIDLTYITQFRLRFGDPDNGDNANDYIKFYSGDYSGGSHPELIITYTLP